MGPRGQNPDRYATHTGVVGSSSAWRNGHVPTVWHADPNLHHGMCAVLVCAHLQSSPFMHRPANQYRHTILGLGLSSPLLSLSPPSRSFRACSIAAWYASAVVCTTGTSAAAHASHALDPNNGHFTRVFRFERALFDAALSLCVMTTFVRGGASGTYAGSASADQSISFLSVSK